MGDHSAIQRACQQAGITAAVRSVRPLSGGCIHSVAEVTLVDSTRLVAKTNNADELSAFSEERHSLEAILASGTVATPTPIVSGVFDGRAVLLMSWLAPSPIRPDAAHWARFGRELAALHLAEAGSRFGFDQDNHIGSTPQPNSLHDDWVEFNAINRLGFQIALAADNGLLESAETQALESVVNRLDQFIPRRPRPSLLHGDLWSGNALACAIDADEVRIAVIDPASSIGDGWADIAMMKLFGGFPAACFDAYDEVIGPLPPHEMHSRLAVYSLYHLLNHVNIFGRGYAGQAMSTATKLLKSDQ